MPSPPIHIRLALCGDIHPIRLTLEQAIVYLEEVENIAK